MSNRKFIECDLRIVFYAVVYRDVQRRWSCEGRHHLFLYYCIMLQLKWFKYDNRMNADWENFSTENLYHLSTKLKTPIYIIYVNWKRTWNKTFQYQLLRTTSKNSLNHPFVVLQSFSLIILILFSCLHQLLLRCSFWNYNSWWKLNNFRIIELRVDVLVTGWTTLHNR